MRIDSNTVVGMGGGSGLAAATAKALAHACSLGAPRGPVSCLGIVPAKKSWCMTDDSLWTYFPERSASTCWEAST